MHTEMSTAPSVAARAPTWILWTVAGVVLAPPLTVFLPQRLALPAQAGLVVALLGALLIQAGRDGRRRVLATPGAVAIGLLGYAVAAGWGCAVGVLAGNPMRYLASQTVSMLLLPLGYVAFRATRRFDGRALAEGLALGLVVATGVHLSAFIVPWLRAPAREEVFRFVLRNNVSVLGAAVLGFILLAAHLALGDRSRVAVLGFVAASVMLIGGMSRGAWLAAALGLVVIVALGRPADQVRRVAAAAIAGAAASIALVALTVAASRPEPLHSLTFDSGPGELVLRQHGPAGRRVRIVEALELPTRTLDVTWVSFGEPGTSLNYTLAFADEHGVETRRLTGLVVGVGEWSRFHTVVAAPPETTRLTMWLSIDPRSEVWRIDEVRISAVPSPIGGWARQLWIRASSLLSSWSAPAVDGGARYRIEEGRAVVARIREATWTQRLTGAGLGAAIEFESLTWDDRGRRVTRPSASYLHNFYLFLCLKLGVMGLVALLGLLAVVWWTLRRLLRCRTRGRTPAVLLGSTASWIAFLVWSVTSPEIYDFMMAPLWGALVAACVRRVDADVTNQGSELGPTRRPPGT